MALPRWLLALWLLVVLGVHWQAWGRWQQWQLESAQGPPIERLKVELRRPMALQTPSPPGPVRPNAGHVARRLAPQGPTLQRPDLQPVEAVEPKPIAELPPLPELPSVPSEAPDAKPGIEWPLSVKLRYTLVGNYNGPVHGDAEVEWLRQGEHYQVRLRVQVGPRLAPLVRRDLISEGRITPEGVSPLRYEEVTRLLLGAPRRQSLAFGNRWFSLPSGAAVGILPGMQDSASQFVQIAWLFLTGRAQAEPGTSVELPLVLPSGLYPWRYEVLGSEAIDTGIGNLQALRLRPVRVRAPGALMAEMWLLPELQYLPVQIRINQSEQTWVLLTLAEQPLQEDPPPQNAASQPAARPTP